MVILARILQVLVLFCLLFSSRLLWENDILHEYVERESVEDSQEELQETEFPWLITKPLQRFLYKAARDTKVNNQASVDIAQLYLARRPLDANAWLLMSVFYQRQGDQKLAIDALKLAHFLSRNNSPILLKVFNRYLEMGVVDEAAEVAHDISLAKPIEFRRLFYILVRLSNEKNYMSLVENMIPAQESYNYEGESTKYDQYYNWALEDSVKASNATLARHVWHAMPAALKKKSRVGLGFINYLAEINETDFVKKVWYEVYGVQPLAGRIGGFTGVGNSPCWRIGKADGVEVTVNLVEFGQEVLKLDFLGDENLKYYHLSCLVFLEPGAKYKLSVRSKGEDVSTLSGPYIDLTFPGHKSQRFRSDDRTGSWPWTQFEISFEVPSKLELAKIRIRRDQTEFLDSKIHGRAWFQILNIEKTLDLDEVNEE